MSQSAVSRSFDLLDDWCLKGSRWLFEDKRALRGTALARILAGISVLGLLTTNFRVRDIMFGAGSVWNKPMQDQSQYAPPHLIENLGNSAFLFYYLGIMLIAVLFILGWHTRFVGPLLVIGAISIFERNPALGDQGDNILRVGLILLLFMHTNEYWSLDARRRARTTAKPIGRGFNGKNIAAVVKNLWNSQFVAPRWLSNGTHNIALAMLGFQLIVIYIAAGMFKTDGTFWQRGTAIYYPMQLTEYKPFPFISDLMTHFGVMVNIATYVVVFTQLFFSLMLLNVISRRIAISLVILFHLSIAVLMALPWFSLSMIAFDAIWVSTSTLAAFDLWVRGWFRPVVDLFWDVVDPIVDRLPKPSKVPAVSSEAG